MNKVWILLLITNGCIQDKAEVKAYKTEAECNMAADKATEKSGADSHARCASLDYLIEENYGSKP